MSGEPMDNLSAKERLEAQRALGGEKIEKQLRDAEQARKLEAEQARNKIIKDADEKRRAVHKEELEKENKSWQKKVSTNKAEPAKKPPQKTPPTPKTSSAEIPALRTFQGDVAKAVRNQKESVTTIALAEQKKQRAQRAPEHKNQLAKVHYRAFPIKKIIISLGGVLVLVSLAGGIFYFLRTAQFATPGTGIPAKELAYTAPIEVSEQEVLAVAIDAIPSTISSRAGDAVASATFKDFVFIDSATGLRINTGEFLSSWAYTMPEALVRNLEDVFFVGVYSPVSSQNEIVLVFDIQSREQTLAGMLAWESTMPQNLSSLYASSGPFKERFQDTIFRYTDARVLRDENGIIRMGYAIVGNTLVVSTGSASLNALIEAEPIF